VSVEPTPAQLEGLRDGDPAERIALVRLLQVREREAFARWRQALDAAVRAAGGERTFVGAVDGVLTAEDFRADALWIDEFPSRELAAESLRLANPHAASALAGALVLATRPQRLPRLALRATGWWLRLRAGRAAGVRGGLPADSGNRAIDPPAAEMGAFLSKEPARPLYVLNLNDYRDRSEYAKYGRNTMPHILRRGGGPVFAGRGSRVVVGDDAHPLHHAWSEILLVHYPTRAAMLDMLCDSDYQRGLPHRVAGLARAGLVAAGPDA
jgi:uncharacterized protein (DUF1330 family)